MTVEDNSTLIEGVAIVNLSSPYNSNKGQESLDLALALSNFGQSVSLFFTDDAVWQLVQQQQPEHIHRKAFYKTFAALEFYDIDNIYVCQQSLAERGLTASELCIEVSLISPTEHNHLLTQHNQILVF